MSEAAAFSYLRALREQQGLTQEQVVERMGINNVRVLQSWEARKHHPTTENLSRWIIALNGSADLFSALLLDDHADEEQGVIEAQRYLEQRKFHQLQQALIEAQLDDEELADLIETFRLLRDQSKEQARLLLDYGRFLKDRK